MNKKAKEKNRDKGPFYGLYPYYNMKQTNRKIQ